jgi:hypothetical protein
MATAKVIRERIVAIAAEALEREPTDTNQRARCFLAMLSGTMEPHGETAIADALWSMLSNDENPQRKAKA